MEERRVTLDGESLDVPFPFLVFATQNPIDFEGTYPLPEAQQDRFLLKVLVDYPSPEAEIEVLHRHHAGFRPQSLDSFGIQPVASLEDLVAAAVGIPWMAARASLAEGGRLTEAQSALRVAALDALDGMREVRAFGNEGRMLAQLQSREAELEKVIRRHVRRGTLLVQVHVERGSRSAELKLNALVLADYLRQIRAACDSAGTISRLGRGRRARKALLPVSLRGSSVRCCRCSYSARQVESIFC